MPKDIPMEDGWRRETFRPYWRCLTPGSATGSLKRADEAVIRDEKEETGRSVQNLVHLMELRCSKQFYSHSTESTTAISWTLMDIHSKRSKNKGKMVIVKANNKGPQRNSE